MFNDDESAREIALKLLDEYTFQEILERNDLEEHYVLQLLIENGWIDLETPV